MMLLLRFPNSGIRAKDFMRKIGFKLRVMRLNRVDYFMHSCCVFATRKGAGRPWPGPLQGRSTVARASVGVAARGQVVGGALACCQLTRGGTCPQSGSRGSAHRGVACGNDTCPPSRCCLRAATANGAQD
ncbi:hypothetical protein B296_00005410 [Ensete ventricosum]|uniref:Uncharacterized protein n=1 Tax=Ensete ventricosum TaxID=4639 RepID=A0A427AI09_ENSVE|nr:hypothetical protein B296_00005410 [Ensete ventricosum]